MEEIKNKLILVFYVGINDMKPHDGAEYIERVQNKFMAQNYSDLVQYFVPSCSSETRIECLNPQFITDEKTVEKFQKTLKNMDKKFKEITKKLNQGKENKEI